MSSHENQNPMQRSSDHQMFLDDKGESWQKVNFYGSGYIEGPRHRSDLLKSAQDARREKQFRDEVNIGKLTGLGSNFAYEHDIAFINSHPGKKYIVALVDLNGLKQVNDSAGHGVGNEYLAKAGEALARTIRDTDAAYRIGGDEFVLIMEDDEDHLMDSDELQDSTSRRISTALQDAISESPSLQDAIAQFDLHLGASTGSVFWRSSTEAYEDIIDLADMKMYGQKRATAQNQLIA